MLKLPLIATAFALTLGTSAMAATPDQERDVLTTYADIALAKYEDSLTTAIALKQSVDAFLVDPTTDNLDAAKASWIESRVPYQQTEAYRFGNAIVDDWEGRVNAWPLDEGLIDYVDTSLYGDVSDENDLFTANVVANPTLTFGGKIVDATKITPALLSEGLQEADGVESNVATGYHAIEFLLWGQDLNGTGAGAGKRPATDYSLTDCTNGNCDRRRDYLLAATNLLIADLQEMVANWKEGGAARIAVLTSGNGLATILTGMGSLSYGELAGERMQLGVLVHDPEEEHDCFSDNTHWSHYNDALGIRNVYVGQYRRVDGSIVSGPSVSNLVAAKSASLDEELRAKLDATIAAMQVMVDRAQSVERYDQMIGENNDAGNATVQAAIDALTNQTRSITRAVAVLNLDTIEFEGSDSLDEPAAIFK